MKSGLWTAGSTQVQFCRWSQMKAEWKALEKSPRISVHIASFRKKHRQFSIKHLHKQAREKSPGETRYRLSMMLFGTLREYVSTLCCLGGFINHGSKGSVLQLILFNTFINDPDDWIDQVGMTMLEESMELKGSWQTREEVWKKHQQTI